MKQSLSHLRGKSVERLSSRVLYVLTTLSAVIFALYWLIGFDLPFDEDPNFNAPLLTDAVLILGYILILGAIGCAAWSMVRSLKIRGKAESHDNNIPTKQISYTITIGVVVLLLLTLLMGSPAAMSINGATFANAFWLKVADMFIATSLILMAVAMGAALFGATRYNRKS